MDNKYIQLPRDTKGLIEYLENTFTSDVKEIFKDTSDIDEKEVAFILGQQSIISHIKTKLKREESQNV